MAQESFMDALDGCQLPAWETLPDFGLYMDQLLTYVERSVPKISGILGLTPAMINNYVKLGLIDRPAGKKYSRDALAQLLMIVLLKQSLSQESMKQLLHPPEYPGTEALYRDFRAAQKEIIRRYQSVPEVSRLTCALESATLSLAFRLM